MTGPTMLGHLDEAYDALFGAWLHLTYEPERFDVDDKPRDAATADAAELVADRLDDVEQAYDLFDVPFNPGEHRLYRQC